MQLLADGFRTMTAVMKTLEQDGAFPRTLVAGSGTPTFERRNPANREDLVTVAPRCGEDDVVAACQGARESFRSWSHRPAPARGVVVGRFAQLLSNRKEALARFAARETGKPLREARGSVQKAIDTAELFQGEGRRLYGRTLHSELGDKELSTHRRPLGVVAVITAGNFPVSVPCRNIIPALLCGNTVVWKPSEDAPGTAALLAELWQAAGLPSGVLQVVYGGGAAGTGQHLIEQVEAGRVDKVAFTGSTEVGRTIGEICGRNLQVPSLELGGKNPLVILADADLELAVDGALWAAFGTAGQRCTSAGNIIVDKRVMPAVRDQLARRARTLRIGDPFDETVAYGPFINERFLQSWIAQRAIGVEDGAELLLDGRRVIAGDEPPNFAGDAKNGLYATPRIFDRVKPHMQVFQQECFGPTVNLVEVDGLDEAIAAANGTPYALSSAVYTRDAKAMLRFKEESRAGVTSINNSTTGAETHMPFGGNGWSGNGSREGGVWALDAYSRWQAVNVDLSGKLQRAQMDVEPGGSIDPPDWSTLT